MRVVCPGCAIVYEPPAELLTPGRHLRCARCGETWSLAGEPVEPRREEPAAAPPLATPARRIALAAGGVATTADRMEWLSEQPEPPYRSTAAVIAGWLATCAVLAAIAWGAYSYRNEIMTAWPPSTRLYAGLGLTK